MRTTLGLLLVVAAACGGISKRTVEEEPAGAGGGSGGGVAAGGSGGSVARGGTAGTAEPDLPDACNIGWLDIPVACTPDQTSILAAPSCNAMFRCYLGTVCAPTGRCKACLQAFELGLSGTMSLCVHGTEAELDQACRAAPPDGQGIPPECTP
ncbi:MAG TPA: hypothetical protein VFV94_06635 [Polyangiaceae bacterium]|nr:hypothetical protein [Polyangiaceae bacterium]